MEVADPQATGTRAENMTDSRSSSSPQEPPLRGLIIVFTVTWGSASLHPRLTKSRPVRGSLEVNMKDAGGTPAIPECAGTAACSRRGRFQTCPPSGRCFEHRAGLKPAPTLWLLSKGQRSRPEPMPSAVRMRAISDGKLRIRPGRVSSSPSPRAAASACAFC